MVQEPFEADFPKPVGSDNQEELLWARRYEPQHSRHVVVCFQLPIAVRAMRHARTRARGFTLLEILIVLLLLLALAGLVIPAAAAWLGNVHSDQTRQQVVELIKDQLVESMRSRQPRVLWVASKPLNGAAAASAPLINEPTGDAATSPASDASGASLPPAPLVRWVIGCRPLSGAPDRSGPGSASADEGKPPQGLVDLPRGWQLAAAVQSEAASEGANAVEVEGQATAEGNAKANQAASASTPSAASPETPFDSGEPVQAMILWPSGQIDVLIPMELTEPDGRRWKLEINPWTLSVQWVLLFNPADQAAAAKKPSEDPQSSESQDANRTKEPSKPDEPSGSDATRGESSANKKAQEPSERDGTKTSEPDDKKEKPGTTTPR
ncbi:MAG: prepilin-type N-terminal cleavage/methylation domain-containing protein [Planctomycetota bacterium]|nr:prepilin-type N-terminal cleavage/methylation domain-containing protein [Planctomycetota bacterium]